MSAEFHAVWDGLIIAKALRTTPYNYTAPLPNAHVESSLRGAIYDPFIRRIVWEGLLGRWAHDLAAWTACASDAATPHSSSMQQHIFGVPPLTDDETVCPYFWAAPVHALNCEIVWPPALDSDDHPPVELDTPEYAGRIADEMLLEQLLAMAGISDPKESRNLVIHLNLSML